MKPAYAIPSMAEIAKLAGTNGLRVVSTFSGCGGACLGLKWAGFEIVWASEFVPAAAEVYRLNHPGVPVSTRDIRDVTAESIRAEVDGPIDLLEGSPPCSSFSMSGNRDSGWGSVSSYSETEQRTDDLFFEFARLLRGLQPRAFIAENVAGLVRGRAVGYFKEILAALQACGYRVSARVLDAAWLGTPQRRKRLIFIGVRNDIERKPVHPRPLLHQYTIGDALPWLRGISTKKRDVPANEPSPTVLTHAREHTHSQLLPIDDETWFNGYAIAKEWDRLAPGEGSDRYLNLIRPHVEEPSPTVTAEGGSNPGTACVTHPIERRKFSIAELRRVCGFPDDFQLTGRYAQQWERLGRAVPPPMYFHVGRVVAETLS